MVDTDETGARSLSADFLLLLLLLLMLEIPKTRA